MTPERWKQIEETFLAAAELPQPDRARFLEERCADDPELKAEVVRMLQHDLETEPDQRLRSAISQVAAAQVADPKAGWIGRRLGPYRVTHIIGQGGMGAVFGAVRDDDEFHKTVAIKTLRFEASGQHAFTRFRLERQLLASLEHPCIARLLDGGTTELGTPYLVMEFVEGVPIDQYCRVQQLTLRQKIALIIQVCSALQYAHQRLVVHRDIKPGNILVTAAGIPKLLDFGIAKLLDSSHDSDAPLSATMGLMTPDYASPEQVSGAPISTATDVYSLGALLYELLTGSRAHRLTGHDAAQVARVICSEPVTPPSTHGDRRLRGDLDTIVLKAMQKEPERRYSSAGQLAEDLQRYLDGLPLMARPDSILYRLHKAVRRHWAVIAVSAALLLALVAGAVVSIYEARRAEQNARDVRALANHFVFDVYDELLKVPGNTKPRQLILSLATEYLARVSRDASTSEVQKELATAYERLGNVYATYDNTSNLGMSKEAVAAYREAIAIHQRLGSREPEALLRIGKLWAQIGRTVIYTDPITMREASRNVQAAANELLRAKPDDPEILGLAGQGKIIESDAESMTDPQRAREAILRALDYAGRAYQLRLNGDGAAALFDAKLRAGRRLQEGGYLREGLAVFESANAIVPQSGPTAKLVAQNLAVLRRFQSRIHFTLDLPNLGDRKAGALFVDQAGDALAPQLKADPADFDLRMDKGYTDWQRVETELDGEPAKATEHARSFLALMDGLLRDHASDPHILRERAIALRLLSLALARSGQAAEALSLLPGMLREHERLPCTDWECRPGLDLGLAQLVAAQVYAITGDTAAAERLHLAAIESVKPLEHVTPATYTTLMGRSDILVGAGDFYLARNTQTARTFYRRALDIWAGSQPPNEFTLRMTRDINTKVSKIR